MISIYSGLVIGLYFFFWLLLLLISNLWDLSLVSYNCIFWIWILQSGCCKPPTACTYNVATTMMTQDPDCYRWNNAPNLLCYECDSCKAGVLEDIRGNWHKLSVLTVTMLVLLIGIYSIGCCAFRNTRRAETDYPYAENRMTKVRPRWDYHWWVQNLQNHIINSFPLYENHAY